MFAPPVETYRFRAFISYSRSDRQWAKALQARLERYVLPQALRLIKPGMRHDRRPLKPIFRDEDELVPGQDLPVRIRRGLEQSEYLLVVCSPGAAASDWVGKEINDFIALGRVDNILAVVVDGEPNAEMRGLEPALECLPRQLRFQQDVRKDETGKTIVSVSNRPAEPLWVDWRKTNHRNRPMFLRLVAALLSLSSLDELVRKDLAYRRRRAALLWSMIGSASCCILGLGVVLMIRGRQAESRALAVEALQGQEGDPAVALEKAVDAAEKWHTVEAEVALNTVLDAPLVRVILHHPAAVSYAWASNDGTRVFTAAGDGRVYVWETASGRLLATLNGRQADFVHWEISADGQRILGIYSRTSGDGSSEHRNAGSDLWDASGRRVADFGNIGNAAFSLDSKSIVTVDADGRAKVWNAVSGILELVFPASSSKVIQAAFSPESDLVVTVCENYRASVWDAHSGHVISQMALPDGESEARFSPNGKLVLIMGYAAKLFDAHSGRLLTTMTGENSGIASAAFSPDSKLIVTADAHGDGVIWDTGNYHQKVRLDGISDPQFSPDSRFLLASNPSNIASVWDVASGQRLRSLRGHTANITRSLFLGRGDRVITTSDDHTARIWEWEGGRAVANLACDAGQQIKVEDNPLLAIMAVTSGWIGISAKDGSVASFADGGACLWDLKKERLIASKKNAGFVKRGAFSSDFARIATVGELGPAVIWSGNTLQPLGDVACSKGALNDLEFSPDAKSILAACEDGLAVKWNIQSFRVEAEFAGHAGPLHRAVFSRDRQRIVTASDDHTARVWDAATGKLLLSLQGHTGAVNDAVFSPDGRYIVTASEDHTACVWDAANGKLLATLRGHDAGVRTANFSADGKLVVTAGQDQTVRVWDARTGSLLPTLEEVGDIRQAVFSPDGKYVLTSDSEGVRVWSLEGGKARQLPAIYGSFAQFSPDGKQVLVLIPGGITSAYIIDFQELMERAKQFLPINSGD